MNEEQRAELNKICNKWEDMLPKKPVLTETNEEQEAYKGIIENAKKGVELFKEK